MTKSWCSDQLEDAIQAYDHYLRVEKRFAPSTIKSLLRYLRCFLRWMASKGYQHGTYQCVVAFAQHLQDAGVSVRTVNVYLLAIKHYYTMRGHPNNPAEGFQVKGVTKHIISHLLSEQALTDLYEKYPLSNLRRQRDQTITGLLVFQALSREELDRLHIGDIHLKRGVIHIRSGQSTYHSSGLNERIIPLQSQQILDLQGYITQTRRQIIVQLSQPKHGNKGSDIGLIKESDPQLFIGMNGSRSMKGSLEYLVKDLKKINPSVLNPRQLRSSRIALWIQQHGIRQAQYLAGHNNIKSTIRYQQDHIKALQHAILSYHPLNK